MRTRRAEARKGMRPQAGAASNFAKEMHRIKAEKRRPDLAIRSLMTLSWSSFCKLSIKQYVRKWKLVENSFKNFGKSEGKEVVMSRLESRERVCRVGSLNISVCGN